MRATQWMVTLSAVAILAMGCAGSEESAAGPEDEGWTPPYVTGLSGAGMATNTAWMRAVNAGAVDHSEDIPEQYWADEIAALRPVRVYQHRTNLVVVQRVTDGVEEGKYIPLVGSSYLPMQGVDGFTYTPNPQTNATYHSYEMLDYARKRDE